MVNWFLVPCLVELRIEFNDLAPKRDKGADGSIGNAAHAATTSDHNPDAKGRVLAVDIDSTGPWPTGMTFDAAVMLVVARCRLGIEDRVEYVIWNRFIYRRSAGFAKQAYTGTADPHTGHAHFSARHDHHGESVTRTWGLLEEFDVVATQDMIDAAYQGLFNLLGDGNFAVKNPTTAKQPQNFVRDALRNIVGGPVDQAAILAAINAHDDVDELALADALVPGLTTAIVAALPDDLTGLTGADVETAVRNVLRTGVE